MSYLQGRGIHIDRHLSNIAMNYQPRGFVADQIFPVARVDKQTGVIPTWTQADLFRIYNTTRAPGHEANKIEAQVGSESYACKNYALKADVTVEDRANADAIWINALEEGRTNRVMTALKLDWDNRVAGKVFVAANVGTAANVASAWTDLANSDPWTDILNVMDDIEDGTGYRPNNVMFGGAPWRHFSRNDKVIDKINETSLTGASKTASQMEAAQLLQVDRVLVGAPYKNTAEEAIAMALGRIWGDHVLCYFTPDAPSTEEPSFGYSLRWAAPGLANLNVERHPYDTRKKCDEVEIGFYQDEKITASALGGLVSFTESSQ